MLKAVYHAVNDENEIPSLQVAGYNDIVHYTISFLIVPLAFCSLRSSECIRFLRGSDTNIRSW